QRHGARANSVSAKTARDRVAMGNQRAPQFDRIERMIMRESIFLAVRLALPVGDYGPGVMAGRQLMQMRPHISEKTLEHRNVAAREVADRRDSPIMHARECHASDAP